jgi:hypothetical protein
VSALGDPDWVSTSRERRRFLRPGCILVAILLVAAAVAGGVLLQRSRTSSAAAARYREAYSSVSDAEDRLLTSIENERRKGDRAGLGRDLQALATAFQTFHDRVAGLDFGDQSDRGAAVLGDATTLTSDLRQLAADPQHTNANTVDDDLANWDRDTVALADALGVVLPTLLPAPAPIRVSP